MSNHLGYLGAVATYVPVTTVRAAVAHDEPNGASSGTAQPAGAHLYARPSDVPGWAEVSDSPDVEGQFWYVRSSDLSPPVGAARSTPVAMGTGTKLLAGGVGLVALYLLVTK